MSIAAPVRPTEAIPYAESQPQRAVRHASPDWLPVIGWFVDDGMRHSRINVVPMGNTVDPHERFSTTLKFFKGGEQPRDRLVGLQSENVLVKRIQQVLES